MYSFIRTSLTGFLIASLILPSPLVFAASGITADPSAMQSKKPTVDTTINNVPLINIAPPSASGLSHNQYSEFNVHEQGAILHNSANDGASILGGMVLGNPNLQATGEAKTILNEVTGANRSHIEGYIEVFGKEADVILANPNGVTINGGGFINTGKATITTGKPDIDAAGKLLSFEILQGNVLVGDKGFNATNLKGFDIISRATEINGAIHAQNLQIITGQNTYDVTTNAITPLTPDGSQAPLVAIDSSQLGGMYANRIILTSTEKGVGVNLEGLIQSQSDLFISSEGKLLLQGAQAEQNMQLSAQNELTVNQAIAGQNMALKGEDIAINQLKVEKNLDVNAKENITLNKSLSASQHLSIDAKNLIGHNATILGKNTIDLKIQDTANLQNNSTLFSEGKLQVEATKIQLENSYLQGKEVKLNAEIISLNNGKVFGTHNLKIWGNFGSISKSALEANTVDLQIKNLLLNQSRILGVNNLESKGISTHILESTLEAGTNANINYQVLKAENSYLAANKNININASNLTLSSSNLTSGQNITLIEDRFFANNSQLLALNNLKIKAQVGTTSQSTLKAGNDLDIKIESMNSNNSNYLAVKDLNIDSKNILTTNSTLMASQDVNIQTDYLTSLGEAVNSVSNIDASKLKGSLFAGRHLFLTATNNLSFTGGLFGANKNIEGKTGSLNISEKAMAYSGGQSTWSASNALTLTNAQLIFGGNTTLNFAQLNLNASNLKSSAILNLNIQDSVYIDKTSTLLGFQGLNVYANNLHNYGLIFSANNMALGIQDALHNYENADILSKGSMLLTGRTHGTRMNGLYNTVATIESLEGDIQVDAQIFRNKGTNVTTNKVKIGSDYTVIGWVGGPGFDNNAAYFDETFWERYGLDPNKTADKPYDLDGNKNYFTYRAELKKSPFEVIAYVQQKEAEYGIPAYIPNKGEGLQVWTEYYEDQISTSAKSAFLLAAGNMFLNIGQLENYHSTISSGNNLSIIADTLTNRGTELSTYMEGERRFVGTGSSGTRVLAQHDSVFFNTSKVSSAVPSVITTGGRLFLDVKSQINNSAIKAFEDYVGKTSGTPSFSGLSVSGNIAGETFAGVSEGNKGQSSLEYLSMGSGIGGMFVLSQQPTSPYLIQVNPVLTDLGTFYGSEYFFNRIGYNLNKEHMRILGDAFYETRMIREQLLASTGARYLFDGISDDAETMRRLMDNAASEGLALGLSVGIALTPEQVSNLNKDIVWLEESTYMGEKVLVPRLYLTDATKASLSTRGAMLTGNEVIVQSGDIQNSGMIRGTEVRLFADNDLLNRGGDIVGKDLLVARADGSLINQSGTIGGKDVSLFAGKDLTLETLLAQNGGLDIRSHQQASVYSTGNLQIEAGNNIELTGASIKGGGNTLLKAENDINLNAQQLHMENSGSGYSVQHYSTSMSTWQGNDISGESLKLDAGNNINLAASSATANKDLSLKAGGNVNILALQGEEHYSLFEGKKGSFGNSNSHSVQKDSTTILSSNLEAGGNLNIQAGTDQSKGPGSITFVASNAEAKKDVDMYATGDILLSSSLEKNYSYESSSNKNLLSSKSSLSEASSTTQVGSFISADNVNLHAKENILISASGIQAENNMNLKADKGDIIVSSGQNSEFNREESKKSGLSLGNIGLTLATAGMNTFFSESAGVLWSSTSEKEKSGIKANVASLLTAGNNLNIDAGRDISIIGSVAYADNNINLNAQRDVNLIPGQESAFSEYSKTTSQVGLWSNIGERGFNALTGLKKEEVGASLTGDYSAGTYLNAGNDVNISAGQNLNQIGSHIAAGRDVIIDVGNDWNMLAAADTESLSQYSKTVQSGISASLSQSVSTAGRSLMELPQSMTAGQGGAGYSALTAASAGLRAVDSVKSAVSNPVSASISIGMSASQNESQTSGTLARPSSVSAGRDIDAIAGRDITIEGGKLEANRHIILDAGRDLNIISAQNTESESSSSSSASAGVGVKATVGSSGWAVGVNVNAAASGAKGTSSGNTHVPAEINAGDTLYSISGRDTTVAGAHLEADKVWIDVGRDLTVASVQDSQESKSSSWSAGVDVTVGYGASASVDASVGKSSGSTQWVGEQTSIVGREEVDIYVEENTHLKGSIIATLPGGDLTLDTGTLTYEEIQDSNKSKQIQGGASVSISEENSTVKPKLDSAELGYSSLNQEGVLRPTVTEGTIIVRDNPNQDLSGLNRDLERAREITKDERVNVDVYVSPEAIKEVMSGLKSFLDTLDKEQITPLYDSERERQIAQEKYNAIIEEIAQNLLATGATPQEINELYQTTDKYNISLGSIINSITFASIGYGWVYVMTVDEAERNDPAYSLFGQTTPLAGVLTMLAHAAELMNSLTPTQQKLAEIALNIATGGPIRASIDEIVNQVMNLTGLSNVLGELTATVANNICEFVYGDVFTKDWQYGETTYSLIDIDTRKEFLLNGAALGVGVLAGSVLDVVATKSLTQATSRIHDANFLANKQILLDKMQANKELSNKEIDPRAFNNIFPPPSLDELTFPESQLKEKYKHALQDYNIDEPNADIGYILYQNAVIEQIKDKTCISFGQYRDYPDSFVLYNTKTNYIAAFDKDGIFIVALKLKNKDAGIPVELDKQYINYLKNGLLW